MHGFALVMGSVMGHPWAQGIVLKCSQLVTAIKRSRLVNFQLHQEVEQLRKIPAHARMHWLVKPATTRFSTVSNCLLSVLEMEAAFRNLLSTDPQLFDSSDTLKAAKAILQDRGFFPDLEILTPIARPFNEVKGAQCGLYASLTLLHMLIFLRLLACPE